MRVTTCSAAVFLGALVAMTAGPLPKQAQAGKACDEAGLSSPCVRSSDLKSNITLEEAGKNGKLRVRNDLGETALELSSNRANATNLFSNDEDESNGLVKAWAQIAANGTIIACWRCNKDPAQTQRFNTGSYEVDFTPLATDITGRPRSVALDQHLVGLPPVAIITMSDRGGDPSSVFVDTNDIATGAVLDASFVLIIY